MIKRDRVIVVIVIAQILVFSTMTILRLNKPQVASSIPPTPRTIRAEVLIDSQREFLGDQTSPITLVEFGDYECAPCANASKKINELVKQYPGKIRFQFRHFPNIQKHPYSLPAAIAAEEARSTGRFWDIHEKLFQYKGAIDSDIIANTIRGAKIKIMRNSESVASKTVTLDIQAGKAVEVSYTPTFFVCFKDGTVVQLNEFDQVKSYLK